MAGLSFLSVEALQVSGGRLINYEPFPDTRYPMYYYKYAGRREINPFFLYATGSVRYW